MVESLKKLLVDIRRNRDTFLCGTEETVRQGAVLPVLEQLGWNTKNVREVMPESSVKRRRVDYCLRLQEKDAVIVEVKRAGKPLEAHQEQLLEYAFRKSVKIAVLTDGFRWWFYLPNMSGRWEERRLFDIDLQTHDPTSAAQHFQDLLGRDEVASGRAVTQAEELHRSREKQRRIRETLPKAWERICGEPSPGLIGLLASAVEHLCGHRPDQETVAQFLKSQSSTSATPSVSVAPEKPRPHPVAKGHGFAFKRPESFVFKGQRYPVSSFADMLLRVCELLYMRHGGEFVRTVIGLRGRQKPYFAKEPSALRSPREIRGAGIYVEVHFSATDIVRRIRDLLHRFGYSEEEFSVEVH